jgi:hypothetical protein
MTSSELPGILDQQHPIRQRPLQRLRLAPGRAHPDVALFFAGQDHRHRLVVDLRDLSGWSRRYGRPQVVEPNAPPQRAWCGAIHILSSFAACHRSGWPKANKTRTLWSRDRDQTAPRTR